MENEQTTQEKTPQMINGKPLQKIATGLQVLIPGDELKLLLHEREQELAEMNDKANGPKIAMLRAFASAIVSEWHYGFTPETFLSWY